MKLFGYQRDGDKLLELEEVSIQCDIKELEQIIHFLSKVKEEHAAVANMTSMCHSHFKDWNPAWQNGEADIIIVTKFGD